MAHRARIYPVLAFRVREIQPATQYPLVFTTQGQWRPSRQAHHNILLTTKDGYAPNGLFTRTCGHHNYQVYILLSSGEVRPFEGDQRLEGLNRIRTASLYHANGRMLAIDDAVVDAATPHAPMPIVNHARHHDFQVLHFQHDRAGRSAVFYGASADRMYGSRHDQDWVPIFLPEGLQPEHSRRGRRSRADPYGQLSGDYAIMIALLALTAEPTDMDVHNTLLRTLQYPGSWNLASPLHGQGAGWQDYRGVLVEVFLYPHEGAEQRFQRLENSPILN